MDSHNDIERSAAETILDSGVSMPLVKFHFPFRKKLHALRITIRRPYLGTQIRLARRWLATGLRYDDVKSPGKEEQQRIIAEHGKELSRMAAGVIWRGSVTDRIFGSLTALLLRRFADQRHVLAIITRFALLGDISAFADTIRLAQTASPMTPRLSQSAKGS